MRSWICVDLSAASSAVCLSATAGELADNEMGRAASPEEKRTPEGEDGVVSRDCFGAFLMVKNESRVDFEPFLDSPPSEPPEDCKLSEESLFFLDSAALSEGVIPVFFNEPSLALPPAGLPSASPLGLGFIMASSASLLTPPMTDGGLLGLTSGNDELMAATALLYEEAPAGDNA